MKIDMKRAGFTIVEVLVVIATLGLLMALLFPAVQSARESARRLECQSRLSQLGRALHNFEQTYHCFPASQGGNYSPQSKLEYLSPHVHLLPYVDEAVIFSQIPSINISDFTAESAASGIPVQRMAMMLCPSDPSDFGCNFRFCTGSSAYDWSPSDPSRRNGAFTRFVRFGPGAFTDGLSNTIGASEKIKSPSPSSNWSPRAHFWYSGLAELLGAYPSTSVVVQTCDSLNSPPSFFGWHAGNSWLYGYYDFTLYNHAVTPNSPIADCSGHIAPFYNGVPTAQSDFGVFAARSYHSGGVNCMLMDGSVRFFGNSVDLDVWQSLATRAGGEMLGDN